jgi:hypothetical protein
MAKDYDRELQEQSLLNVRDLVDKLEREQIGWKKEKVILLSIGMLVLALVGALGVALTLDTSRKVDLERHRCEVEHQSGLAWKEMELLKKTRPELGPGEVQALVDSKRAQFKDASRAACARR